MSDWTGSEYFGAECGAVSQACVASPHSLAGRLGGSQANQASRLEGKLLYENLAVLKID